MTITTVPAVSSFEIRVDVASDPRQNRLLAALPDAERERWLPQLEPVDMTLGEVLYESGRTLTHVYFPTTSIISLLYVLENGASAEIAVVGHDGIVGISLFMGGESTTSRAVAQSASQGFRLMAHVMFVCGGRKRSVTNVALGSSIVRGRPVIRSDLPVITMG